MVVLLAACGGDRPAAPTAASRTVRLAALVPLSGRGGIFGEGIVDGAELAVREANAAGGVLGLPVELVVEDDACDPGTAVTAAQRVLKRDITVSVGGYCSSAVGPTLVLFRAAGVPMIVAQANSNGLLALDYDSVFLMGGTAEAEANVTVDWITRLGGTRMVVVHDGTSLPVSLAEAATAAAARTKKLTLTASLKLSQGAFRYTGTARAALASKPDVIYFTGYHGEATQFIKDLRAQGFRGRIVLGDGSTGGPLLENLTVEQSRQVYGTTPVLPDLVPALAEWSAGYQKVVGSPPGPSTVQGYDAVRVALDAITRADSLDREAIRKAIAATDLTGLSGRIRFDRDGVRTEPTFLLVEAQGGKFRVLGTGSS
jgi:branched-chain amino acid transport system substrate-binding protein